LLLVFNVSPLNPLFYGPLRAFVAFVAFVALGKDAFVAYGKVGAF